MFGKPEVLAALILCRAREVGYEVNVAVADSPDAAFHAARYRKGITVIRPGHELKYLGDLPLGTLNRSLIGIEGDRAREIFEVLDLWGIKCLRDLALLPEAGVAERLGFDGVRLQKLATGQTKRPLMLTAPTHSFEKRMDLEHPIKLIEPLSFILGRLLKELCDSLANDALAANELRLKLALEDKTRYEKRLSLPFPTRDPKTLLKLLLLEIESAPPQAPIVAIEVAADPAKPRSIQRGLFQAGSPEPEKLELTIARIAKLVGAGNVGSPEVLDTHRPGAFRVKKFSGLKVKSRSNGRPYMVGDRSKPLLGFRVFRPPLRADVQLSMGQLDKINACAGGRRVRGKVVQLAGPWRTSGDWWDCDEWARDEWDVELSDGGIYRIYRDLKSSLWFIEGAYD